MAHGGACIMHTLARGARALVRHPASRCAPHPPVTAPSRSLAASAALAAPKPSVDAVRLKHAKKVLKDDGKVLLPDGRRVAPEDIEYEKADLGGAGRGAANTRKATALLALVHPAPHPAPRTPLFACAAALVCTRDLRRCLWTATGLVGMGGVPVHMYA